MELSELGNLLMGFIGGSGFGAITMAFLAYKTGIKTKQKTKLDMIEERLAAIEHRIGL